MEPMAGTTLTRFPPKAGEEAARDAGGASADTDRELGRDLRLLANALGEASRAFHRIAARYPGSGEGRASGRRGATLSPVPSALDLPRPPTLWSRFDPRGVGAFLRTAGLFMASLAVTFAAGVASVRLLQSGPRDQASRAPAIAAPTVAPAPPPAPPTTVPAPVEPAARVAPPSADDARLAPRASAPARPAAKRPALPTARATRVADDAPPAPARPRPMTFDDDGVLEPSF